VATGAASSGSANTDGWNEAVPSDVPDKAIKIADVDPLCGHRDIAHLVERYRPQLCFVDLGDGTVCNCGAL
jgi:hypothetical protein